jgi:hypothetical protein
MINDMHIANVLSPGDYSARSVIAAHYPAMPGDETITPPSPSKAALYQAALTTLRSYARLEVNWDYENGRPLAPGAEAAGVVLLNAFASSNIVPNFSPLNDGGVLFEIDGPVYLALDVQPTGMVHMFLSSRGQEYEESGSAANVVAALFGHPNSAAGATR